MLCTHNVFWFFVSKFINHRLFVSISINQMLQFINKKPHLENSILSHFKSHIQRHKFHQFTMQITQNGTEAKKLIRLLGQIG